MAGLACLPPALLVLTLATCLLLPLAVPVTLLAYCCGLRPTPEEEGGKFGGKLAEGGSKLAENGGKLAGGCGKLAEDGGKLAGGCGKLAGGGGKLAGGGGKGKVAGGKGKVVRC